MAHAPKPIKRSKHLVPLSREHHFGLLLVWKIRQGLQKKIDANRIIDYLHYIWQNQLQDHFEKEERILLNYLAKDDRFSEEIISQHERIRQDINNIKTVIDKPKALENLADELERHIRFEERTVFPHIEKVVEEEILEKIGSSLSHQEAFAESWNDVFWERNN